jgi:hypothetical protein
LPVPSPPGGGVVGAGAALPVGGALLAMPLPVVGALSLFFLQAVAPAASVARSPAPAMERQIERATER